MSSITRALRGSRIILPALAGAALILGACNGADEGTPTPSPTSTSTATSTASPTATATAPGTATASPSPTSTATEPAGTPSPSPTSTPGGGAEGEPTVQDALDTVQAYYDAIDAGDYQAAYALWSNDGAASGQTFEEFRSGFQDTATVSVVLGEPGRVDPAAGSRFIEVPVEITATLESGQEQRFEGSVALRRGVIEGAVREWRLYSADITQVN